MKKIMQLFFSTPFAVREAIGKWSVRCGLTSGHLQFIFTLIISFSVSVNAEEISWHQSLDSQFDIVETFDHLQDWNPLKTGYHYNGQDMPKQEDGARGMWANYSNDRLIFAYELVSGEFKVDDDILFESSGINARIIRFHEEDGKDFIQIGSAIDGLSVGDKFSTSSGAKGIVGYIPKWIGDHGKYTLGAGKSLAINYNDFSGGVDGFGPSRLGVFFGDGETGNSGYKKIHVFFMIRFRDGFFWKNENRDYAWVGTLKLFHLSSGFTAIDHYGTSDEYQTLEDTPQTKREYGTNATIVNVGGGGLSSPRDLFLVESTFVSELKSSGWGKTAIQAGRAMSKSASASFSDLYERDEWIGVELVSDLGDVGEANGSTQVYLYSQKGEQIGYWSAFNYNKLRHFDHKYNKFVFGGNRLCFNYGSCQEGLDSRYYVDDFIIHGDRIAPTYFELKSRKGSNDLKPNPPENINIK